MSVTFDFQGYSVLVTGGVGGIGRKCCLAFLQAGASVTCGDVNSQHGSELMEEVKQQDSLWNDRFLFVQYDASQRKSCEELVASAESKFGKVDVLVNNVGIPPAAEAIHALKNESWERILNVNLNSVYWTSSALLKTWRANLNAASSSIRNRSIINNASIQGMQSQKQVPAYAASKGAVLSLTRQMAIEYGCDGIRVNAVSPGSIVTPLFEESTPKDAVEYARANTPLGKLGMPQDIANAVLFLASEAASHITGQNIVVDGGITIKGGWMPL